MLWGSAIQKVWKLLACWIKFDNFPSLLWVCCCCYYWCSRAPSVILQRVQIKETGLENLSQVCFEGLLLLLHFIYLPLFPNELARLLQRGPRRKNDVFGEGIDLKKNSKEVERQQGRVCWSLLWLLWGLEVGKFGRWNWFTSRPTYLMRIFISPIFNFQFSIHSLELQVWVLWSLYRIITIEGVWCLWSWWFTGTLKASFIFSLHENPCFYFAVPIPIFWNQSPWPFCSWCCWPAFCQKTALITGCSEKMVGFIERNKDNLVDPCQCRIFLNNILYFLVKCLYHNCGGSEPI